MNVIPPRARTTVAVTGVVVAFVGLVGSIAWSGRANLRVIGDQNGFQLPAVRQFARQWPHADLHDYPVATAPGYHLLLAAVSHYVRDDLGFLRVVGGVFGVALVGVTAWAASRRSAALALPLAASWYVVASTVWLLPENAAWLLVAIALLLALRARGATFYVGSAGVLATLVFVRQAHAWAIGVFVVAALVRRGRRSTFGDTHDTPGQRPDSGPETGALPRRDRRDERVALGRTLAAALVAAGPAVVVLMSLLLLWHGLSPPSFRPGSPLLPPGALPVGGFAPGAPGMLLAVVGMLGTLLLPWLWPRRPTAGRIAAIGAAVGFVLGVLPASSYAFPDRRSGLWNLVQRLPVVFDRSPLFVALATAGGAVAAAALARLPRRERWVLGAALAGFAVTLTQTSQLWQRYYEPFVLIWLILAAASGPVDAPRSSGRLWRGGGLTMLVLVQVLIVVYTLGHEG